MDVEGHKGTPKVTVKEPGPKHATLMPCELPLVIYNGRKVTTHNGEEPHELKCHDTNFTADCAGGGDLPLGGTTYGSSIKFN